MGNVLRSMRSSKLLKDNSVMFAGSMLAAALNYLFYPVLGRFLSPAEFGEVQVLATLVVQSGLVFGLARIAIMSEVANAASAAASHRLFAFSERLLLQLALAMTVLAVVAAPFIADVFKYDSVLPLYILIPSLVLNALRSSRDAYARVSGRFGISSLSEISASLIKLLFATMLAAIGLGTIGAVFGLLAAYIASAVAMVLVTSRLGPQLRLRGLLSFDALRSLFQKGAVTRRGAVTLSVSVASLVVVGISTLHTIIAKALLSPREAGLFAGIAVIATIVFFATGSIAGVLLASIRPSEPRAANIRKLGMSALLMGAVSVAIAAVFCTLPEFTVRLLLGVKYITASDLLPTLTMAMLAMAGTNLVISYHIAMRDKFILPLAGLAGSVVAVSLALWHASPAQLAFGFMVGNLAAFGLTLGWTTYWHKRMYTHDQSKTD